MARHLGSDKGSCSIAAAVIGSGLTAKQYVTPASASAALVCSLYVSAPPAPLASEEETGTEQRAQCREQRAEQQKQKAYLLQRAENSTTEHSVQCREQRADRESTVWVAKG